MPATPRRNETRATSSPWHSVQAPLIMQYFWETLYRRNMSKQAGHAIHIIPEFTVIYDSLYA